MLYKIIWLCFRLTSRICSLVAVSDTSVVCASELPLEKLCKPQDTFLVPDLLISNSNAPITNQDDDIIRPREEKATITQTLLNLPRNSDVRIS